MSAAAILEKRLLDYFLCGGAEFIFNREQFHSFGRNYARWLAAFLAAQRNGLDHPS
jgi:hypothetical protein